MTEQKEKFAQLQKAIDEHKGEKGALMPVLQAAQSIFGCVPMDVQEYIADALGTTLSDVYGVATFYSQFSLQPKGKSEPYAAIDRRSLSADAVLQADRRVELRLVE